MVPVPLLFVSLSILDNHRNIFPAKNLYDLSFGTLIYSFLALHQVKRHGVMFQWFSPFEFHLHYYIRFLMELMEHD